MRATGRAWAAVVFHSRVLRRLRMIPHRSRFGSHGIDFFFDPKGVYTHENVFVGNNVNLGQRPTLVAAKSRIVIGDDVMFGPEVAIFGGGHNMSVVGTPASKVHWKRGDEDLGVSIGNDVWVGTRAVLLRGVDVGRGVVVAAGSVVTKSVPDYAVIGGNPAKVLSFRFSPEEAIKHEEMVDGAVPEGRLLELRHYQNQATMLPRRRRPI